MPHPGPIGLFDSGVGGISIMREVRRLLPAEDLVYLADSAHCPYGSKPAEYIIARSIGISEFLISLGAKVIVVACNTATGAAIHALREKLSVPVVGVEPGVKPAVSMTRTGKVAVMATGVTLGSQKFSSLVERYGKGVEVITQPCPGLVELVEAGKTRDPETYDLLHKYLDPLLAAGTDVVVLGCTHYPFLRPAIQDIVGPHVAVLDTGEAVARQTARVLQERDLASDGAGRGREVFFTTGDPSAAEPVMARLWGEESIIVEHAEV